MDGGYQNGCTIFSGSHLLHTNMNTNTCDIQTTLLNIDMCGVWKDQSCPCSRACLQLTCLGLPLVDDNGEFDSLGASEPRPTLPLNPEDQHNKQIQIE